MKRHAVFVLRNLVQVFPKPMRELVKRNQTLTNAYRRTLALSGFLPSNFWDAELLYRKNQQQQQATIEVFPKVEDRHPATLLVIVHKRKSKALSNTLISIAELSVPFQAINILTGEDNLEWCADVLSSHALQARLITGITQLDGEQVYVVFSGDCLHQQSARVLSHMVESDADIAYVDTDRIGKKGMRTLPEFYPDWNPDLQLSSGYVNSGIWVRNAAALKGFADFAPNPATMVEWLDECYLSGTLGKVQHIPLVLLHRPYLMHYIFKYAQSSLYERLRKVAHINFAKPNEVLSLKWHIQDSPLVSLIIPTYNAKALVQDCIESILKLTNYQNYEILLVDNNSDDPECLAYFDELDKHPKIRVLKYPKPFNYSAINNFAATHAKGDIIGLVNNDIEVIDTDWLGYMVAHVMRPDIGCVGAKLLFSNQTVQHAGVVMGYGGGAGHAHKYFPSNHSGYLNRLAASHNFSAVTAACLLVTKADFDAIGGLNEVDLTVAFNDVDFCLRILELGRRNLYCAEAVLFHHESVSRGTDTTKEKAARFQKEVDYLQTTWGHFIEHDPAYNPNLTLKYENFAIRD